MSKVDLNRDVEVVEESITTIWVDFLPSSFREISYSGIRFWENGSRPPSWEHYDRSYLTKKKICRNYL